jgi:type II secretory pathway component PulM
MASLLDWWRGRSARERLLLIAAFALLVFVAGPLLAYRGAATYREEQRMALIAARAVLADAQAAAFAMRAAPGGEGPALADRSARGVAQAAAESLGLAIERIEPIGPDRVRLVMRDVDSVQVYRWIEAVGKRGGVVQRASLVRAQGAGRVTAEFELAAAPT